MGSTGGFALWIALLILTTWRLLVLARTDEPTRMQKATALLFGVAAASNTFGLPFVRSPIDDAVPGLGYLVSYILLMITYSGFVYLFSSREKRWPRWLRSFPVQLGIAAATSAVFAALWLVTPPEQRCRGLIDLGRQDSPLPYLGFCTLGTYLLAASAVCAVLAWGESRSTLRCARTGYTLAALGMALCGFGGIILRVPLAAHAWTSQTPITDAANQLPRALNLTGIAVLLIGLLVVAAHNQVEPRRAFLALRPLYTALYATFPRIALHPPESFFRELTFSNAQLRQRWPHRAIACTDGLRATSAHLCNADTSPDGPIDITEQARLVLLGLTRATAGAEPVHHDQPITIATPADDGAHLGFDSEIEHLIALSRAIAHLQNKPLTSTERTQA